MSHRSGLQNAGRRIHRAAIWAVVLALLGPIAATNAEARTWLVPVQRSTIQAAVDSAAAGDVIVVAPGRHCGARIDKRVALQGLPAATIVGCPTGPVLFDGLRAGFVLPGEAGVGAGSGITIRGFRFDGAGVNDRNTAPLAFGVFARFADDVTVEGNTFVGTVQAITNTAGHGWRISGNRMLDLSVFDCVGRCAGGDGIVVQAALGPIAAPGGTANPRNRPRNTIVMNNDISAIAPPGFTTFSMAGIIVNAADASLIANNRLALRQSAMTPASGVVITSQCCGLPEPSRPGARFTAVILNDGAASDRAVTVEGDEAQNTLGLLVAGNRGTVVLPSQIPQRRGNALVLRWRPE